MDEWDSIDWDEKVKDIVTSQEKSKTASDESKKAIDDQSVMVKHKFKDDDGNYFEENQEKSQTKVDKAHKPVGSQKVKSREEEIFQSYSTKDLERICNYTESNESFHLLIYETFGQFERFLLTHQLEALTHENIVDLIKIDVCLLEVPFVNHNQLLLNAIASFDSFWTQLIVFLKEFFKNKHKDVKFLLSVSMNNFFIDLENMMHKLIIYNYFNDKMEEVFNELIAVMKSFNRNKWCQPERLERIQEDYKKNQVFFRIYDVVF